MQAAIGVARQQPERMPAMHERVERECMRLDALVGEVLTLARMESAQAQPPRRPIDVVALMEEVCNDAGFEARAAQRDLAFHAQGSFVAEVNVELLCRAFENVVRNAVKYTREGSTVQVQAEATQDTLTITVTANAIGKILNSAFFKPPPEADAPQSPTKMLSPVVLSPDSSEEAMPVAVKHTIQVTDASSIAVQNETGFFVIIMTFSPYSIVMS